jgi:DNA-dependent RNA polymerase auxiliary subunit epsilon
MFLTVESESTLDDTREDKITKNTNPFTEYLAQVMSKLKQDTPNLNDEIDKIRAINIKTIKDLEDCLLDYEKTENALNEL